MTQVVGGGRGRLAGNTGGLAGWPVTVGVVETRLAAATLSGRGARVYACTMHVSMITYRVDVYRSRPIGASLLAGRGRPGADAER